jgi:hypothetical protein
MTSHHSNPHQCCSSLRRQVFWELVKQSNQKTKQLDLNEFKEEKA